MLRFRSLKNAFLVFMVLALCVSVSFAAKKSKETKDSGKSVDSGTFGIFVDGKRVASEKFQIEQSDGVSLVNSEFSSEQGEKVRQQAELRMAPNGDLRHYSWKELSPGKGQATVEPSGEFLVERVTPDPPEKPAEIPLLVPVSTAVLDDYFFSQREVLIWRYMAHACGSTIQSDCTLPKLQFGVLVPRQRTTASVVIEYKGKEKVNIKGTEQMLDRFILNVEGDEWTAYLDENMKLMKIVVPSERTEVVRE